KAFSPLAQTYYWLERGRAFNSSDNKDKALECFERAVELDVPGLRLDAWHMLAIAQPTKVLSEELNRKALGIAELSDDPEDRRWRGTILNNLGWDLHEQGKFKEALRSFEDALKVREEYGIEEPIRIAKWCIARCLRSLKRFDEAMSIQQALKDAGPPDQFVDEE